MDPLSILSLVEACAGLTVTAGKLAIGLKSLADNYKQSALTFRSLSSQCRLFATSVRAIQAWMEEAPELNTVDDRIWEQLADSLECANDAIYALENELVSTSGGTVNTFWEKVNVVWNLPNMKDLEDCIHKQICSLSVILQIMNLPTTQSQTSGLRDQFSVFQESRASAMSLRDVETSTLKGDGDGSSTIRAPSTIMTSLSQLPHFDFDEMLLTSQVYLRNRNKTLAMNSRTKGTGEMHDAETSVSMWDLPPQPGDAEAFDLQAIARDICEGKTEKARMTLIFHYHVLQDKYKKVKRYYFKQEAHVTQLQKELEALKANIEEAKRRSSTESEIWSTIELEGQVTVLREAKRSLEAELKTARETEENISEEIAIMREDWYKARLPHWDTSGASISSSKTADSTGETPPNHKELQRLRELQKLRMGQHHNEVGLAY